MTDEVVKDWMVGYGHYKTKDEAFAIARKRAASSYDKYEVYELIGYCENKLPENIQVVIVN